MAVERQAHAGQRRDFVAPGAGAVDHHIRFEPFAGLGSYAGGPPAGQKDLDDPGVGPHAGPERLGRAQQPVD